MSWIEKYSEAGGAAAPLPRPSRGLPAPLAVTKPARSLRYSGCMSIPSSYEREQFERIIDWQLRQPDIATRLLARGTGPASHVLQSIVPTVALRMALDTVQAAARRLSNQRSVLRRAGVSELADLARGPLERSDRLARQVARRSMLMASGTGALFGAAGGLGLVVDVPSLLVIAFRSIHRVGLCYGEDCLESGQRRLPLAIFALASSNTMEEKQEAFAAIQQDLLLQGPALRGGVERTARRELVKETATVSLNRVARQVGTHLGWRKAAESLPLAGALVGGSVNAWYLHDVARTARFAFQLRWLEGRYPHLRADTGVVQAS